ncbi:hypothetical protein L198_00028 [Cryptococcus wingfieldii CBS 7118]|uniref:Uncharacterized protein n=1 Tax=Cryptococcus wingfieldii CBS 7118 TaxID=1295528 RepID=A0A1E3K5L1_9TREE|nr:hypothetical protein L198_00028 [Cryptococcus wingfieldii CBS 7118]ODO08305.1 hypothetical protein L198_00028 [Cryptococcus wingfieldii CBS 7118]
MGIPVFGAIITGLACSFIQSLVFQLDALPIGILAPLGAVSLVFNASGEPSSLPGIISQSPTQCRRRDIPISMPPSNYASPRSPAAIPFRAAHPISVSPPSKATSEERDSPLGHKAPIRRLPASSMAYNQLEEESRAADPFPSAYPHVVWSRIRGSVWHLVGDSESDVDEELEAGEGATLLGGDTSNEPENSEPARHS